MPLGRAGGAAGRYLPVLPRRTGLPAAPVLALPGFRRLLGAAPADSGALLRSGFGCIELFGVTLAIGAVVTGFAGCMPVFGAKVPVMAVAAKVGNHGVAISKLCVVSSRLGLLLCGVTGARVALAGGAGSRVAHKRLRCVNDGVIFC